MLAIAIPSFNRPHYLKQVLEALEKEPLHFPPAFNDLTTRVIVSYDRHDSCDPTVALQSKVVNQVIVHKAQHGHPLGITRHVQWLLNHCVRQGHNYVMLLEDDCVPFGDWKTYVGERLLQGNDVIPLHPDCYRIGQNVSSFGLKVDMRSERTSSWGVIMSRKFIIDMNSYSTMQEYDWDYSLNDCLDAEGYRKLVYCPAVPRVKHIGVNGLHFNEQNYPAILTEAYQEAERLFNNLTQNDTTKAGP